MNEAARILCVACLVVSASWAMAASEVAWDPNPLSFNPGETGPKAVAIYFRNFSAPTTIKSVGFRIKSTAFSSGKLKFQADGADPKVTWELPMTLATAAYTADGIKLLGRFASPLSGAVANQKIVTVYIERGTAVDGETFTVEFDVANTTDNGIILTDDSRYEPDTWQQLTVRMLRTPDPPRDVTAAATTPQKDPVRVTLTWTDRHADDFEMQWKRPSESSTQWKNVTTGMVEDIENKTIDWTTQGTPGFGTYETIQIRVRVLDQGKVWSGSAIVDAATNPNVGWKQVPNNVVVDNDPPGISSASGTNGVNKVTVVFDEPVHGGYAGNPDHYAVHWAGHPDIQVTAAAGPGPATYELTLAAPLLLGETYTVTATNIPDVLGNMASSLGPVSITVQANPPRDVAWAVNGLPAATKDPVVGQLTWGAAYMADAIQVQYSENGTTWNSATVTPDLNAKTFSWNTGFTEKTIYVRARVLDHGKVWNGTAVVDAAANPNAGWVQWGSTVRVDNVAPGIASATATDGDNKVYVNFSEDVADSAADPAKYIVRRADNQQQVAVNAAQFQGTSKQIVVLTLASALSDDLQYELFANQISDRVGNTVAQISTTIQFKPKLVAASLKQDGVNRTVVAEFNVPMASIGTASQWSLRVVGGSTVSISAVAIDPGDAKKVNVTTAAALSQNTDYQITCPSTATSTGGQQVGADNSATFTTPFWHAFTVDSTRVYSVGIPLNVSGGRVRTLLSASAIAHYDPTGPTWTVDSGGATQIPHVIGKGYFAKWGSSGTVTAYMTGTPVTPPQNLAVPAGWSLITNPFLTNLNLAQVTLNGTPLRYAWWWDGTAYRLVANLLYPPIGAETALRPWVGYWMQASVSGTVQFGAGTSGAVAEPSALGGENAVLIPLVARAGNAQDVVAVCGVGQAAEAVANPPFAPGSVDLAFVGGAEPLAIDVRTGAVTQKWDLVCKTDLPNVQVTISATDLSRVPQDYAVILTDLDTGKKTYLRTSAGYTFTAGPQGAERRLVLEIVPRSGATLVTGVAVAQAEAGRVVVTYALTAPASVTAEVMNIAGRIVKRLAVDRAETAGTHTLSWDLTNNAGSVVPRGTYLLSIVARTDDGQQVKAVRTFTVNR